MKKKKMIKRLFIYNFGIILLIMIVKVIYTNENIVIKEIAYKEPSSTPNKVEIVWDGLTMDELAERLNKNLYNELSGTGKYFAEYTAKTGMDPYLAVSIVNLETGCKWKCSYLARNCYNIGGLKGKPSCNGGAYAKYDSLEDGINSYLNILYKGYWSKGLDTAEKMNKKYAESTSWAEKVNRYYETIKAS